MVSGGPCGRGVRAVHPALTYGHGRLARVLFRRGDDFAARRRKRTHSRAWSRPSRSLHRTTSASGRHARTRAHARHAPRAAPGAAGQKGGGGRGALPSAITSTAGTQQQQQPKYRTCDAAHPGPGVGGSPVPQEGGLSTVRRPTFLLVFFVSSESAGGTMRVEESKCKSRQTEGVASGEQSQAGHGGRAGCGERGAGVGAAR